MNDNGDNGFSYPYKALSPVSGKTKEFTSIDDVHGELLNCYQELEDRNINNVADALYSEHFFFCNTSELLDPKIQQRIKEYNFCKTFSCPPFPSLQETPARIVDDFLQIDNIVNTMKREKSNG